MSPKEGLDMVVEKNHTCIEKQTFIVQPAASHFTDSGTPVLDASKI
jgi:hypothetical protein